MIIGVELEVFCPEFAVSGAETQDVGTEGNDDLVDGAFASPPEETQDEQQHQADEGRGCGAAERFHSRGTWSCHR